MLGHIARKTKCQLINIRFQFYGMRYRVTGQEVPGVLKDHSGFKMLINNGQMTKYLTPEKWNLQQHCNENLKSHAD